ncbi:MAG: hypothetical protein KGL39_11425 [Patescibacteria group bacterium]|nr:hypothetical protein [Patescibacteria group bacterium]
MTARVAIAIAMTAAAAAGQIAPSGRTQSAVSGSTVVIGGVTVVDSATNGTFNTVTAPGGGTFGNAGTTGCIHYKDSSGGDHPWCGQPGGLDFGTASAAVHDIANCPSGTVLNAPAKPSSNSGSPCVTAAGIGDSGVAHWICTGGCGNSGNAQVADFGPASCIFDSGSGTVAINDWFGVSTTTANTCHDYGPIYPTNGINVLGQVMAAGTANGTTAFAVWTFPWAKTIVQNLQVATYSMPYTAVVTLVGTPVTILPAPTSGGVIVDHIEVEVKSTGQTAYTAGNTINFVYHGQTNNVTAAGVSTAVVTSGTTAYVALSATTAQLVTNNLTGIDATVSTTNFACSGTCASLYFTIYYTTYAIN